ncbi:polyadenylate-binding protein 8-like [Haliotis rubra]|uniref:polyadenylate-binding protein 8-like n=1 Tax=Haliotis rubra TaxID=36100 RepID=UPI001EE51F18|nr:polyadenylate-binding protein 8-like [Haliotis rubra]
MTASDLFQYFVKFGDLMKFDVFNNDEGKCTGTGIVQFVNEEDAVAALAAQPHFIHKKQIIISRDREDDPKTNVDVKKSLETHKLFVTDIPLDVSEEDLCEYFSQWGNISFCDVTGKAKWTRHVLVSYTNYADAIKCLKTPHNYGQSVINVSVATHCKALRDHDHKRGGNKAGEYAILKRKNSLFVSNIPDDVIPEELTEHFSMLGEIVSCKLGGKLRQNNNFGFVRFKERDDALKAVIMPHTLKNQRIFVHVSERKSSYLLKASKDPDIMSAIKEKAQSCYLYVPDMNASTTEDQLYEHFKTYGGLASCMIISNAAHPHSAHLAYANEADAARCFHDDNHFVNNEKLTVLWSDWTKWGGEDRRGLPARAASPPRQDSHAGPPKHSRRAGPPKHSRRAGHPKHSRRAGRSRHKRRGNHPRFDRRGNPPRHTGPDRDDGLDYPQCEAEFEFDDGCVSSWNC